MGLEESKLALKRTVDLFKAQKEEKLLLALIWHKFCIEFKRGEMK